MQGLTYWSIPVYQHIVDTGTGPIPGEKGATSPRSVSSLGETLRLLAREKKRPRTATACRRPAGGDRVQATHGRRSCVGDPRAATVAGDLRAATAGGPEYLARVPSLPACCRRPRVACAPSPPTGRPWPRLLFHPRGKKERGDYALCIPPGSGTDNMSVHWYGPGISEASVKVGAVYKYDLSLPVDQFYGIVEEMRNRLGI
ncbi:hypothetical protein GW17_00012233 [Ensete ventricosum]|nr:hypothetical protein GW17_00012233 [Ensete ventricosum]